MTDRLDILRARRLRLSRFVRKAVRSTLRARRTRAATTPSLNDAEFQRYSQNGEDGIIAKIFENVGTTNRYAVEFGVEDGIECNTAYLTRQLGWSALLLEGSPEKFAALHRSYRRFPAVAVAHAMVDAENVAAIFERHAVPIEFDLLSIDVDGNDLWLWLALERYRPRVVVIEYNALYPPPVRWIMRYAAAHRWDGTAYQGASLTSLCDLAQRLGYGLVATDSHGVNAFFVRGDVLPPHLGPRSAAAAYHSPRYNVGYRHHPFRTGDFVEHPTR